MRKLWIVAVVVSAIALASPATAQINDVYQLEIYRVLNPATVEQTVDIINPGQQGTPVSANHGTVCADIYLFDNNQEMLACCACPITANGVLSIPFFPNLLTNTLTSVRFVQGQKGALKIVSDSGANCDATNPVPVPDLRAWESRNAFVNTGLTITDITTKDAFAQAPLQPSEQQFLGQACAFVLYLGSGRGRCSCGIPG